MTQVFTINVLTYILLYPETSLENSVKVHILTYIHTVYIRTVYYVYRNASSTVLSKMILKINKIKPNMSSAKLYVSTNVVERLSRTNGSR